MKDGDLINCPDCSGKGFNYRKSIYAPNSLMIDMYGMVDVEPEECDTCNSKGVVIVAQEKEYATC